MQTLFVLTILKIELLGIFRQVYSCVTSLVFFVIVVSLFPLALGLNTDLLAEIAAPILWIAALLATLLSLGNLFRSDQEEGLLEQWIVSEHSLSVLILCKVLSHWIAHSLPLVLLTPLMSLLLNLSFNQGLILALGLLLGTPALCLLGSIGSALIVGLRQNGLLLPILIMPLYIPVLIFGAGLGIAIHEHQSLSGYFAIIGALSLFSLVIAPLFASMALRIGINQ